MKQPHEIKADYIKADEIKKEADILTNSGNRIIDGKEIRKPILFNSELEEIKESAIEHIGVLKDNAKHAKTEKSRKKSVTKQAELRSIVEALENKKV